MRVRRPVCAASFQQEENVAAQSRVLSRLLERRSSSIAEC
jgi:hypothetical protein